MIETALGRALIHSLWQGTLLGLLVLSVVVATRDPRIRCGAGVAGMALLVAFCVTFVIYLPRHEQLPEEMPGAWLGAVAVSASGQAAPGHSSDTGCACRAVAVVYLACRSLCIAPVATRRAVVGALVSGSRKLACA